MARIAGIDLPRNKRGEIGLTYIYGIGPTIAKRILEQTNIDPNLRAKDLTPTQLNDVIHAITGNKLLIEGDLRRELQGNLKRLQAINCYRGIRHRRGLPVRGQRTSTNARTRKGPRGSTIKKMRAAGRGTYVCETCQPKPRKRRTATAAR